MNTALRRMPFRSLRSKLALLLILAAAIPIVLIGYISYRWIYIVQTEKIETEWVEKAERERDELERKLEELARVSQLLDVEGGIGREVVRFISSGDSYERSMLYRDITDSIANVNFSNPNLGAMFFYAPQLEEPLLFPNLTGPISFSLEVLTPFYKQKAFTYYGPHSSTAEERDGEPVFSLLRKLDYGQGKFLYAYIETGIGGLESLFETEPRGDSGRAFPVYHALVGPDGRVVYGNFRAETEIVGQPFRQPAGQYQTFRAEGRHGWTLYQLIPRSDYDREMNKWLKQFALFASLSLLAGISLAWLIWRMVYRPIRIINREISRFSYNQTPAKTAATGLPEFDRILDNFQAMGRRIAELILDIEDKEKRRGQLEVEKLLVQINPIQRRELPTKAREIQDRLNEITFNASLLRELRAIDFVNRLVDDGKLKREDYKRVLMHRIDGGPPLAELTSSSRMNAEWDFLLRLRDMGRTAAKRWLKRNYDAIGKTATLDLRDAIT